MELSGQRKPLERSAMARASKIRVMISSRCNDRFPMGGGRTLSEIRRDLKASVEGEQLLGQPIFEVWINEEAPPGRGTWDSTEVCIDAVEDCDILVALSNGNAGWAATSGDVGICHLELSTALSKAPDKVRLVSLGSVPIDGTDQGMRNGRFQAYLDTAALFRGGAITNEADLFTRVRTAIFDAILNLTQSGVREASRTKYHSGEALGWSRLNLADRRQAMAASAKRALLGRVGSKDVGDGAAHVEVAGKAILFLIDAVPAAFTVGPAREMVGQPHLREHARAGLLKAGRSGPVHLIACHRTAPEATATRLLGFPDATVVSAPFGTYIADPVQMIQLVFVTNCRDDANTRNGVGRFCTWLDQTGEAERLANRAGSRARIVKAIAKEARTH